MRFWRRHCVRSAPALTVLLSCFAFGSRLPSRFFCRVLPSVHACPHSSVVAFCLRFTPAVCLATNRTACDALRFYSAGSRSPFVRSRDVGAVIGLGRNAELVCAAMRFCCRLWRSVCVCPRGSVAVFCLRSRLLFVSRQTGRLAIACVPIPPGRDRHSCVLGALFGYLPWRVHFGFMRFFMAISTGYRRTGNGGTGLAARLLCAFAQPHRH